MDYKKHDLEPVIQCLKCGSINYACLFEMKAVKGENYMTYNGKDEIVVGFYCDCGNYEFFSGKKRSLLKFRYQKNQYNGIEYRDFPFDTFQFLYRIEKDAEPVDFEGRSWDEIFK